MSMALLAVENWPDEIDAVVTLGYLCLSLGIPLLGYVFMFLDYRAYLRSLHRSMIVARNYLHELPAWARKDTPRCLLALGLTLPCTEEEVLASYRRKVKQLHPDLGGNRRQFLRLQKQFEEALRYVRQRPISTPEVIVTAR